MKKCPNCGEFVSSEAIQCTNCDMYFDEQERVDERCECGNLIAKLTETTIEVKCRRCKRIIIIPAEMVSDRYRYLIEKAREAGANN